MLLLKPFTQGSWSVDGAPVRDPTSYFHSAYGFATQTLAYMLDSLVRVSRRVGWKDQVKLLSEQVPGRPECTHRDRSTYQRQCYRPGTHSRSQRRRQRLIPHSLRRYQLRPLPREATRTSAILPPPEASLTWERIKCNTTLRNKRHGRFDPPRTASTHVLSKCYEPNTLFPCG